MMTDEQIAAEALKHWGVMVGQKRTDKPTTFDDVLMRYCPDYNVDPEHTARWHRIKDIALDDFLTGRCKNCDTPFPPKASGHRQFCDYTCAREYASS